jgi:hypothetical protein
LWAELLLGYLPGLLLRLLAWQALGSALCTLQTNTAKEWSTSKVHALVIALLPAACCLLPAACCLLPAACCLLLCSSQVVYSVNIQQG